MLRASYRSVYNLRAGRMFSRVVQLREEKPMKFDTEKKVEAKEEKQDQTPSYYICGDLGYIEVTEAH
jgi:hypothetical protein